MSDIFPTTPLLDDFNRANENPLSQGGQWTDSWYPGLGTTKLLSNEMTPASGIGGPYRTQQYPADMECWMTVGSSLGTNGFDLAARIQNPGVAGTKRAYMWRYQHSANMIRLYWIDTGGAETELTAVSLTMSLGDAIGFQVIAKNLLGWYKPAAGSWNLLSQTEHSSIVGPGYIGCGLHETAAATDFGGGPVNVARKANFFRFFRNYK